MNADPRHTVRERPTSLVTAHEHYTSVIPEGDAFVARCGQCPWAGPRHSTEFEAETDGFAHTEERRKNLPAEFHQPVWDDLGQPHSWLCAACWGDGWVSSWPCEIAVRDGLAVARAGGMEIQG